MVEVATGGKGTRAITSSYPVTSGLTAGTTKQKGRQSNLTPQEASHISQKDKEGL